MRLGISTKVVTRPEQRKNDGTNVIYLRVTKNRKSRYLSTGLTATAADLSRDRKKIKNYQLLDQAEAIHRRARQILIDHATEFAELDTPEVVERLTYYIARGDMFRLDFFVFARDYLSRAKLAQATKTTAEAALRAFAEYIRKDEIDINNITSSLLRQFADVQRRRGLSDGTVSLYISKIISIYRRAQEEYNDDYVTNIPRILRVKITPPRFKGGERSITIAQIQKIIDIELRPHSWEDFARDCFLISFFLCGMNLTDILKATPPHNGIIAYRRSKIATRVGEAADMRISIPDKLTAITDKYHDKSGRFFVVFRKLESTREERRIIAYRIIIAQAIERLARKLDFPFTFYSARHSFATIARNVLKIDKATIDECLTHVGEHRMTDVYIKRDYSAVNAVCAAVADLFDLSKYNGGLDVS